MARPSATDSTFTAAFEPAGRETLSDPPVCEDAAGLASYVADMTAELAKLAGGANMPMLAYFLNLARVEAEIQARRAGGARVARGE